MESGPKIHFKNMLSTLSNCSCLVIGDSGETNQVCKFSDNVVGVNISFDELRKSKGSGAHLIICDGQKLPLKASYFDVIICRSTLHHLSNLNEALAEMNRILAKDSRVFLHEPGILNFIAFLGRRFFPTNIHDVDEKPFNPIILRKTLSIHFKIINEVDFFLIVHAFPILGKRLKVFGNHHFLRAMLSFDNVLCKTFFKNLCWISIFLLEKKEIPLQVKSVRSSAHSH
jgi:SAM-dependent methyltransferase